MSPKDSQKKRAFTLVELLLVLLIAGMFFGLILPQGVRSYERYRGALEAEKILLFLSEKRREAFLAGKDLEVYSENGTLYLSDMSSYFPKEGSIELKRNFYFLATGTTDGGEVKYHYKGYTYVIEIESPLAEFRMRIE